MPYHNKRCIFTSSQSLFKDTIVLFLYVHFHEEMKVTEAHFHFYILPNHFILFLRVVCFLDHVG